MSNVRDYCFWEYDARLRFTKSVINTRTTTSEQHQGSFGGASTAKSTEGAPFLFRIEPACAGLRSGRERRSGVRSYKNGRQNENKDHLTARAAPNRPKVLYFLSKSDPLYQALSFLQCCLFWYKDYAIFRYG